MYFKEDVARLVSELGNVKMEPPVELGKADDFGLSLDLFDPVSGQIIALARPARIDLGQPQILLTATQARTAVAAARTGHLHRVRGMGFASIEEFNEAHKRDVAAADLKAKQAEESAKMNQAHADAANKAAADAQPKKPAQAEAVA